MSFKDYSPVPASNTEIGDGIYIGPNMERAKVRAAFQQLAADGRQLWDTFLQADAQIYPSVSAGQSVTPIGQLFAVVDANGLKYYLRTPVGSDLVYQSITGSDLAASAGAGLVGFSHSASYAQGTAGDHLKRFICATDAPFNAKNDGVTDDLAAIQAALDFAGTSGGGAWVWLPPGAGYRITAGLKLPSYVGICGSTPSRYPFAASNANVSKIIADFASANQWVIEPKTTSSGSPIAYNVALTAPPDGATYNCAVRDLIITSTGSNLPYGGIRMHGCPGAMVYDVAVYNVGCGLFVNECYGGEFKGQFTTAYYGAVSWGDTNANRFDVYAARHASYTGTVPSGYLMPFLASLSATLTTTYKLSTNAHYNRAWGLIHGSSAGHTSANARIDATVERYSGGVLLLNSYATTFGGLYVEGDTGVVDTAIAASDCTFAISALHSFQSGSGKLFDFGEGVGADIRISGSASANSFGKAPEVTGAVSKVLLRGVKPPLLSAPNQFNVRYPDWDGDWITPTLSGATNVGSPYNDFAYCINSEGKVEFKGGLTGMSGTPTVFTLPAGFRPYADTQFVGVGGSFKVTSAGAVVVTSGSTVFFDNCAFKQVA